MLNSKCYEINSKCNSNLEPNRTRTKTKATIGHGATRRRPNSIKHINKPNAMPDKVVIE
jgi:hypothetical protein